MSRMRWIAIAALMAPGFATASESSVPDPRWSWKALTSFLFSPAKAEAKPQLLAQAPAKPAQAPALPLPETVPVPPPPRFDIGRFDVQGNTLLSVEEIREAVAPYTGKSKDFADVQRALESLQLTYQRRGYGAVQVVLPEQELEQGVIVLRVVEPKLGAVRIEGNQYFDQANIRRSLPSLKEGTTPNAIEIAQDVRLANENAAKRVSVVLRAGANEGEVDALVRVQDEKTWRAAVSFDNTGSPTTGSYRLGVAYQESNLFNLDNTLTFQYQLDPEPIRDADELKILGLAYTIPLYGIQSSIDLLFGYSSLGASTGQVIQGLPFNISGSGTIFGVRYNYMLPRLRWLEEYDHKLSLGADYKSFTNEARVVDQGVPGENLTPDITAYPFSLSYSGTKRMQNAQLAIYGSVAKNFFPHGNDATADRFNRECSPTDISCVPGARPGVGEPRYTVWRYGLDYARALPKDLQLRANFTGQYTKDALIPGEQFGIGGWESLRGLYEREGASDRGYRGTLELYSPDVASHFGLEGGRMRFLTFFDYGKVHLNYSEAAEPCGDTGCGFSASSIGLGMRMYLRQGLSVRLDYGHLLNGGPLNQSGESRWHFGVSVTF